LSRQRDADPLMPVDAEIGRHDRLRVQAAGCRPGAGAADRAPAHACTGQIGSEVALEALIRKRPAVAEEAEPDLPVRDDRAARATSPGDSVSGCGIASPTTAYGASTICA
jgi:hypothetical protein